MTTWFVFHGVTFDHEFHGGFLWAPSADRDGKRKPDWLAVGEVRRGDVVYSCRARIITHVLVATADGAAARRPAPPYPHPDGATSDGNSVAVRYAELPRPRVALDTIKREALELFTGPGGPLDQRGHGNMGYLYRLNEGAAEYLRARALRVFEPELERIRAQALQ
ncbi:MAG: hypothetical protein ACOZNI_28020 [Myxococcota bacterium]